MAMIIDGKMLAEKINQETCDEIKSLSRCPNLAIILVGDNPDSELFVNKKIKKAREIGMEPHLYKCDKDSGQAKILEIIDWLNQDDVIDGIMLQLPLPKDEDYDTDEIIARIRPDKDIDRFHPENIAKLTSTCDDSLIKPPVFGVILEMLDSIKFELEGSLVTVLSNSEIFGDSLAKVLGCHGAEVQVCRADDPDLKEMCVTADLLIPVIGRPKLITSEMVKEDAVVIDVGITYELGSVCGDVDFEDVKDKVSYISPVPGGVGPMTVAITLRNVLELFKKRNNQ